MKSVLTKTYLFLTSELFLKLIPKPIDKYFEEIISKCENYGVSWKERFCRSHQCYGPHRWNSSH